MWQVIWFLIFNKFVVYDTVDTFIYDDNNGWLLKLGWGLTLFNYKTKNKKFLYKYFDKYLIKMSILVRI